MNPQTNKLFAQAMDIAVPETWTTLTPEQLAKVADKFAELIVRECANFLDENSGYDDCNNAWHPEPEDLLEHFGVEE